jgi:hypothetical protein
MSLAELAAFSTKAAPGHGPGRLGRFFNFFPRRAMGPADLAAFSTKAAPGHGLGRIGRFF